MTPFQGPQPEIPAAPFEIPTPDLPPADFQAAGKEMGTGVAQSTMWDSFWNSLLAVIGKVVSAILVAVMKLFGWMAIQVAKIFLDARQQQDDQLATLASVTVSDLFGVQADQSSFKSLGNTEGRKPFAKAAAEKMLNAFGGSFDTFTSTELQPDGARAEAFITTMMNLAIEGWLEGWVMEALSAGQLETFAELKDILASALGLGRLSHQALTPAIKILVHDPYLWKLNDTFHPQLFKDSTAVRQYLRGRIDIDRLHTELGWQGWSADRIEGLINEARTHVPLAEIQWGWEHNSLSDTEAQQALKDQGYDDATAAYLVRAAHEKQLAANDLELAKLALNAYKVGALTSEQLQPYFAGANLTDTEKAFLTQLQGLVDLGKRRQFGLGQAENLVKRHIWDLSRFKTWATVEGYTDDDERDLELMLFSEIQTADQAAAAKAAHAAQTAADKAARVQAAAVKKAQLIAAEPAHGVAIAKYETLVKDGIRSVDQYRAFLVAKQITPDNQDALVQLLEKAIAAAAVVAATKAAKAAKAATKNLNLGELDKGVRLGVISIDEYKTRLDQAGFDPADVAVLLEVANEDIASAAAKAQAKTDAKAAAAVKHVDLSQEENAVRLGLKTVADFQTFLSAHGFAEEDAATIVAELQAQLVKDKAAQTTKAAAAAKATAKGLSLPSLEKAVRAGVKTIDDYRTALAGLGYAQDAQDSLVSLLQLQMQTDQQNLAAHGTAAGLLGQRGVSLTDLERAVTVGTIPITVYTTALSTAGMSANDAQLLTLTLAAKIAAAKKAATPSAAVTALLKAAGLSLSSLRAAVVSGKLTVDEFTTQLLGAGVDQATVASLAQLASEELANAQAIAEKRKQAAALAGAKGLSLAEEEAAVKAGVKTIADYEAFLTGIGFAAEDVATLSATLQVAIAKKPAPVPAAPVAPVA